MLILLTGLVAFGWTFGVALVVLAVLARVIPRGWMLRDLLTGRGRWSVLLFGSALFLTSTALFLWMEWTMSVGWVALPMLSAGSLQGSGSFLVRS
jgi:hypothetical protein